MKDNQLFAELTAEFEATPVFTELDNEVAASCSGGSARLFEDANFKGRSYEFPLPYNVPDLGKYNFDDKTSSIIITGNERWAFYRDINYQGSSFVTQGPGRYSLGGGSNDSISSLRRLP